MPSRIYLDLSNELDTNEGLYKGIAGRYDTIVSSLSSDDVDTKLKEAILAGIWNAKSWYGLNGKLFDSALTSRLTNQEIINYNDNWLSSQHNSWLHRNAPSYYNWNNTTVGGLVDWTIVTDENIIKSDIPNLGWKNAQFVANKMARHIIDYAMPDLFRCVTNWSWNHQPPDTQDAGNTMYWNIAGLNDETLNALGDPEKYNAQVTKFGEWLKRDSIHWGQRADGSFTIGLMITGRQAYDQLINSISSSIYHWITTPEGPLKNYWTSPFNVINETKALVENTTSILNNMNSNLNSLTSLLTTINNQGLSGWGYHWGFDDYGNELYLQLGKLDELNNSGTALRATYLALDQLAQINQDVDELLNDYEELILPQNINVTKSSKDIDYEKIDVSLFRINDGQTISININDISQYDDFSKIDLYNGLQEGTYMLKVQNKNVQNISSYSEINNRSYQITLQNEVNNLIGWYVNGKYPIVKSKSLGNNNYEIWAGQFDENLSFIEEHYIDPTSLIIEVKPDYQKLIYNFFYGSFFDEYIETLDNGNKVYYRQMKDTNGNPTASYRIEADYVNMLENGMPLLHYKRYDSDEAIQ